MGTALKKIKKNMIPVFSCLLFACYFMMNMEALRPKLDYISTLTDHDGVNLRGSSTALKTEIEYEGRNMYRLKNACILQKRKGILILPGFYSQVSSVDGCSSLLYQNEYGLRNVFLAKASETETVQLKWHEERAHVILSSSIVSFWHFLLSVIPAYEFANHESDASFYFLENRWPLGSLKCENKVHDISSLPAPLEATGFRDKFAAEGVFELLTSPFHPSINVDHLEEINCHREITVGQPLFVHHSASEWTAILQKKKKKIPANTRKHLKELLLTIPENGMQIEYADAVKRALNISECPCWQDSKPPLLFIQRKLSRKVQNEKVLQEIAGVKFNFKTVFLEDLSILEQIKLFSCAEIVIGAAGTGMTWIIFMRPGSSVILFQNDSYDKQNLFERGSRIRGRIYSPEFGTYTNFAKRGKLKIQLWQSSVKVQSSYKTHDIIVDPDDFLLMLSKVAVEKKICVSV